MKGSMPKLSLFFDIIDWLIKLFLYSASVLCLVCFYYFFGLLKYCHSAGTFFRLCSTFLLLYCSNFSKLFSVNLLLNPGGECPNFPLTRRTVPSPSSTRHNENPYSRVSLLLLINYAKWCNNLSDRPCAYRYPLWYLSKLWRCCNIVSSYRMSLEISC